MFNSVMYNQATYNGVSAVLDNATIIARHSLVLNVRPNTTSLFSDPLMANAVALSNENKNTILR